MTEAELKTKKSKLREEEEKMKIYWKGMEEGKKHAKSSPETREELIDIKATIVDMQKAVKEMSEAIVTISAKLDTIFPVVVKDMEEKDFYKMLWKKIKEGGGVLKWIVTVIVAILVLSGYAKTVFLSWLALK